MMIVSLLQFVGTVATSVYINYVMPREGDFCIPQTFWDVLRNATTHTVNVLTCT